MGIQVVVILICQVFLSYLCFTRPTIDCSKMAPGAYAKFGVLFLRLLVVVEVPDVVSCVYRRHCDKGVAWKMKSNI